MECSEVEPLLSMYHDGELPTELRPAMEVHVETCKRCAALLDQLRRISSAAARLVQRRPPRHLCQRVLAEHDKTTPHEATLGRRVRRDTAVAYVVMLVAMFAVVAWWAGETGHDEHDYLADYWQRLESDPILAQEELLETYCGTAVTTDTAIQHVGYRPTVAASPPNGAPLVAMHALKMPCCECIQSLYRRSNGSLVVIFEHDATDSSWFLERPYVLATCSGKVCRITQLNGYLAISWSAGPRTSTVVGLRSLDELSQWVAAFVA